MAGEGWWRRFRDGHAVRRDEVPVGTLTASTADLTRSSAQEHCLSAARYAMTAASFEAAVTRVHS
jgi:hypothetical protein